MILGQKSVLMKSYLVCNFANIVNSQEVCGDECLKEGENNRCIDENLACATEEDMRDQKMLSDLDKIVNVTP